MAFGSGVIWEVRTTGSDSQGGGFDPSLGGTDYSIRDTPIATGTVTSASTTVTATTAIFTAAMVGNFITDGTIWKEITAYSSATVVTVDSAPSWTAASIKVGGALATPGMASGLAVTSNGIYIKAGTYTLSASNNVSGGRMTPPGGASTAFAFVSGYSTNRTPWNTDTPPVLNPGANSVTCVNVTGNDVNINNLSFTNPSSYTGCTGINAAGANIRLETCSASALATCFEMSNGQAEICNCTAAPASGGTGFASGGGNSLRYSYCTAIGGYVGIVLTSYSSAYRCVATGQNQSNAIGFHLSGGNYIDVIECVADNVGGPSTPTGFYGGLGPAMVRLVDCIASNCVYGFTSGGSASSYGYFHLQNCAVYNNTNNFDSYLVPGVNVFGTITCTASPFTSESTLDFSLNSVSGGGSLLKGAGYKGGGSLPGLSGTTNPDVGAYQAGGSVVITRTPPVLTPNTWAWIG
jgi:hypothetical protein